jgi:hypothetical protein
MSRDYQGVGLNDRSSDQRRHVIFERCVTEYRPLEGRRLFDDETCGADDYRKDIDRYIWDTDIKRGLYKV